jgi:D-glutamate N-acetyltransferase
MTVRAIVLAQGKFGSFGSKTANDLVIYNGRVFDVVAILDGSNAGKTSKEFLPFATSDVPIVARLEDANKFKPEALVIGVAPIGGRISAEYRQIVRDAILKGLDIWSGMHTFLSDDKELVGLAEQSGATLHDLRRPPDDLRIWTGEVARTKAARVTVMGTDCDVGKNITTMELARHANGLGYRTGIVATGQTMLMLGTDSGTVIDSIPADFTPGEVERQILKLDKEGRDVIFLEGQAAILHPAYGQVSVAILYGSQPDAVCLAHDPFREWRGGFKVRMPKLQEEIKAIESLCETTKVVAISVMGFNRSNAEITRQAHLIEQKTGLPTADAMSNSNKLTDAIISYLKLKNRIPTSGSR